MKEKEIWKDILDYKGYYQISNLERVKALARKVKHSSGGYSFRKERILVVKMYDGSYKQVALYKDGKFKKFLLSRLVAQTFIPNPDNKPEVNHKKGNKANCKQSNLEWSTRSENMLHAYRTGLKIPSGGISKGEKNGNSTLLKRDVLYIRRNPEGLIQTQLAKKFNVSQYAIWAVIHKKVWKHVA